MEKTSEQTETIRRLDVLREKLETTKKQKAQAREAARTALITARQMKSSANSAMTAALDAGDTSNYREQLHAYQDAQAMEDAAKAAIERAQENTISPDDFTQYAHELTELETEIMQDAAMAVSPIFVQMQDLCQTYLDEVNAVGQAVAALNAVAPGSKAITTCTMLNQIRADAASLASTDKRNLLHGDRYSGSVNLDASTVKPVGSASPAQPVAASSSGHHGYTNM